MLNNSFFWLGYIYHVQSKSSPTEPIQSNIRMVTSGRVQHSSRERKSQEKSIHVDKEIWSVRLPKASKENYHEIFTL